MSFLEFGGGFPRGFLHGLQKLEIGGTEEYAGFKSVGSGERQLDILSLDVKTLESFEDILHIGIACYSTGWDIPLRIYFK